MKISKPLLVLSLLIQLCIFPDTTNCTEDDLTKLNKPFTVEYMKNNLTKTQPRLIFNTTNKKGSLKKIFPHSR